VSVRAGYAAQNLALQRHMTINILNADTTKKRGIKGKQKNPGWDLPYLLFFTRILNAFCPGRNSGKIEKPISR